MRTTKLFFMAALALMTAACSNDDNELTTQQPAQTEGIPFTATITVDKGATTRALAESDGNIVATWAENEQVALIHNGVKDVMTVASVSDGVATISGTITGSPADNDDVTVIYPATAADGATGNVKADLLTAQDGTLAGIAENYDVRKSSGAKLKVVSSTASLKGTVSLTNQNAIFKFTLPENIVNDTHPLVIKNSEGKVITTVTPASSTSTLFVALPPSASSRYYFMVNDDNNNAYFRTGTATIVAGKYYQTTLSMSLRYPVSIANVLSVDLGTVVAANGYIYKNATAATNDNTSASGIIAYIGAAGNVDTSTNVDANCSTYKGLAISLTDANNGNACAWYTEKNGHCLTQTGDFASVNYKNGIANTNTLTSETHTHAAATAAKNYSTTRPSGVSAWFLPSMGQWNLIVKGLATKKAGTTVSTNLAYSDNNDYKASNLNSVITDAGGTGFKTSDPYWSSTEYSTQYACRLSFSGGCAYAGDKNSDNYVRAVFAF